MSSHDHNRDTLHWIGHSILEIGKRYPAAELVSAMLQVYNNTPCCNCRDDAVRWLVKMDALPAWVYEEAEYDSDHENSLRLNRPE